MVGGKRVFSVQQLEKFCVSIFTNAGLSKEDAAVVAECLLCAEIRGISSHGVVRMESYMKRVEAGVMTATASIIGERDEKAVALLDANNTFGQIAGHKAMSLAIDKARQYGVGVVAVKKSNHFGVAAYYAMMAVKADMVGFVLTNASPAMAVYGTKTPLIGTNPLAIAIPAGQYDPIVLDMSTSVIARGKIRYAALTGHEILLGWARDADGKPTQDSKAALKGSLEPIGGMKGSGLSLVIDLICGVMTDSALTGDVRNASVDFGGPTNTGHFFAALNLSRFIDPARFKDLLDQVISQIKALPATDGGTIYMPGEIEFNTQRQRLAEGIPLDEKVICSLNTVASRYGAPPLVPAATPKNLIPSE
jgi:LDH2 family malate/lactate/ureidoglycolate dehydrogenase